MCRRPHSISTGLFAGGVRGVKEPACYRPLPDTMTTKKARAARHRAAVGVSEVTDSVTIVVSEETGRVSVAEEGTLTKIADAEGLKKILATVKEETVSLNRFKIWKGRLKNGKKAV